jgi:hypothetical protein
MRIEIEGTMVANTNSVTRMTFPNIQPPTHSDRLLPGLQFRHQHLADSIQVVFDVLVGF